MLDVIYIDHVFVLANGVHDPMVEPPALAKRKARHVRDRHGRATADRDFNELVSQAIAQPLTISGEERCANFRPALDEPRVELVQRSQDEPLRSVTNGDVRHVPTVR